MTSRQRRLLRGAAASTVATMIAAVSHTLGGGAAPHPLLVVALSVFLTPVAALLVGRRPSLIRLSGAVLVAQSAFHVLFIALGATVAATGAIPAGHQHGIVLGPIGESVAPDAGMLGAHIVAGILTIALLGHGESMLRAIARWVRAVLRPRVPLPRPQWPNPAPFGPTALTPVPAVRIGDLSRRGPPVRSRV